MHAIFEIPLSINELTLLIKPGKCLAEQVGVNAPGNANKTTFLFAKYSSVVISFIPSLPFTLNTPSGNLSPILIDIL